MTSFQYPELKAGTYSIRLLRVVHDVDSAPIACKLYSFKLMKCPQYVAVSYSWGSSLEETEISLNDKPFRIRNNGDVYERNHQVGIMREVYRTAVDVLVWLGISTPQSNLAMDYIARQSNNNSNGESNEKSIDKIRSDIERYKNHQRWTQDEGKSFLDLCRESYWSRVWIIQEIMNARHIIVFRGSKSFDWECLASIFQSLNSIRLLGQFARYYLGGEVLNSGAAVVVMEKHSWDTRPQMEREGVCLSTLITRYRHSKCTNPLDKIYGLLGLSCDAGSFEVDYRKSVETVYNEVLTFVCHQPQTEIHRMKIFERELSAVFGFIPNLHPVLTVEEIVEKMVRLQRALQCPEPSFENGTEKNRSIMQNYAQPVFGESELETTSFSSMMIPDFSRQTSTPSPEPPEHTAQSADIPRSMGSVFNPYFDSEESQSPSGSIQNDSDEYQIDSNYTTAAVRSETPESKLYTQHFLPGYSTQANYASNPSSSSTRDWNSLGSIAEAKSNLGGRFRELSLSDIYSAGSQRVIASTEKPNHQRGKDRRRKGEKRR